MKNNLLLSFFFIALTIAKETPNDESAATTENATTLELEKTTVAEPESSSSPSHLEENSIIDTFESNHDQSSTVPKRKILYVNQQQSGKFNVHLELNDVSLIVIPNRKDPQLSLLNLLLRSAQKSNNLKKNEQTEHEKNNAQVKKASKETSQNNHNDEYSKYKTDNYVHSTNEPYVLESRVAPYKVDISSTLSQPSPVEIIPNANLMTRSPFMKILNPIPVALQQERKFKRSIDSSSYGFNFDSPVLQDKSISSDDNDDEQLTESITNSLENDENLNAINSSGASSEFVLLGVKLKKNYFKA